MRGEGTYDIKGDCVPITCILRENLKKEFYFDQEPYTKLSLHIGKIPCVMIAPDDVQIITGSSEERRKLMDSLLSQMHPTYLRHLILYNKVLIQRNSLLKNAAESGYIDPVLLETINEQLIENGNIIYTYRKELINKYLPEILSLYLHIAGQKDDIDIQYQSQLYQDSFDNLLNQSLAKDQILQRTNVGIHKDDLGMLINGFPLRKYASQGQQKSYLIALKLAQFDVLSEAKNMKPLLLLDDIFEKLDQERITALMTLVSKQHFGQIFITDSHPERIAEILRGIQTTFNHFTVHQGTVQSA